MNAAEGLLHRAAEAQGAHLVANQGFVLAAPSHKDKKQWWVNGLLEWGQSFGAQLCRQGHPPVYAGTVGPALSLLPKSLHPSCETLALAHELPVLIT